MRPHLIEGLEAADEVVLQELRDRINTKLQKVFAEGKDSIP